MCIWCTASAPRERANVSKISFISQSVIDVLESEAAASPRRRKNLNYHDTYQHPCQRMLSMMHADSYVPPHRHLNASKDEIMVILRGRSGLVFFDESGAVTQTQLMVAGGECLGVNIPAGQYHTIVAFDEGATVFECKAGPYEPHAALEKAPFAPGEGDPGAAAYMAQLKALFSGKGA